MNLTHSLDPPVLGSLVLPEGFNIPRPYLNQVPDHIQRTHVTPNLAIEVPKGNTIYHRSRQ